MNLSDAVTLRHLRCFIEVYHLRSVAEAALALGITQSAASRRITDLEVVLDQRLFNRQGRKLVPNGAARVLLHHAEGALMRLNTGLEMVSGTTGGQRPELAIGALPTVAAALVPRAILSLRKAVPDMLIRVETGAGNQLLPQLRSGHLDVLVGRIAPPAQLAGLRFEHLFLDRLAFVTRADHPLTATRPALGELTRYPMVLPTQDAVVRPTVDAFLMARGIGVPEDRIETTAASVATAILLQSEAIWAISRGVAEAAVAAGQLAFLKIDTIDTIGAIGATRREDEGEADPQTDLLLDALREEIAGRG